MIAKLPAEVDGNSWSTSIARCGAASAGAEAAFPTILARSSVLEP